MSGDRSTLITDRGTAGWFGLGMVGPLGRWQRLLQTEMGAVRAQANGIQTLSRPAGDVNDRRRRDRPRAQFSPGCGSGEGCVAPIAYTPR
jgi:hypothetical protein